MTQRELAEALGFRDRAFIYKLETGKKKPNVEHVLKLAHIFGVTTDQLIRDEVEL
jgi:transcriptional regulator with XRE-family HTH domain